MKKILFVAILALGALTANSQITRPRFNNTICATHTPTDLGVGVRYDHYFHSSVGIYVGGAYGRYRFQSGYIEHSHASIGCVLFAPEAKANNFSYSISAGTSFHNYAFRKHSDELLDYCAFYPMSFEFGGGINIWKFSMNFRWDPVKRDSSIDIGYNF